MKSTTSSDLSETETSELSLPFRCDTFSLPLLGMRTRSSTFAASDRVEDEDALGRFHEAALRAVMNRGGAILHEKAFGAPQAEAVMRATWDAVWESEGLAPAPPLTYVVNRPCVGGLIAGIQLWSVDDFRSRELAVTTVTLEGRSIGRLVESETGRILFLSNVTGEDTAPGRSTDTAAQCAAMFDRADRALRAQGFTFRDVARTWLHVGRLLDWYDELNRVRNGFFERVGVRRRDGPFAPPASTGIQGGHPGGAECLMDVLAAAEVDAATGEHIGRPFEPMSTTRQNEAPDYGSAFSRGMALGKGPDRLLLVSGTASIDTEGRSIYLDDPQGQIVETFLNSAAVLRGSGASLSMPSSAVIYFKDEKTHDVYREIRDLGVLPALPVIAVYGDVCRDELLVELEVTVARTRTREPAMKERG